MIVFLPVDFQVVLCMSENVDREAVHSLLCGTCQSDGEDPAVIPFTSLTTLCHPNLKHRFTILFPPLSSNLYSLLDVAKVCVLAHTYVSLTSVVFCLLPKGRRILNIPLQRCVASFDVIYSFCAYPY